MCAKEEREEPKVAAAADRNERGIIIGEGEGRRVVSTHTHEKRDFFFFLALFFEENRNSCVKY